MFRNLRTSTKLLILCGAFIISIVIPIYGFVAEKQIAIDFARLSAAATLSWSATCTRTFFRQFQSEQ